MRFSDITRAGTGSGTIQTVFLWAALVIHLISLVLYWEVYWSIAMSSDCSFNEPSHFIFILIQQFNSLTNCSSTLITGKLKDSVIYKLLTYAYIFIIKISRTSSFSSVQFSRSVVADSLQPHELPHPRPPCPSPTPGVHPNPCPLSQWCHPTSSSSVVPFSSCPQSFPTSGSFQMSQLLASRGQSIGVSASTSVLPMNTQDLSPESFITECLKYGQCDWDQNI